MFQCSLDTIVEDGVGHMGVHSTEGVIQEDDVCIRIDSTSQADPSLLSSTNIDSSFSDSSVGSFGEKVDVFSKLRCLESALETFFIEFTAEGNVILEGA